MPNNISIDAIRVESVLIETTNATRKTSVRVRDRYIEREGERERERERARERERERERERAREQNVAAVCSLCLPVTVVTS